MSNKFDRKRKEDPGRKATVDPRQVDWNTDLKDQYHARRNAILKEMGKKGHTFNYELMYHDMSESDRVTLGLSTHSVAQVRAAEKVCEEMTEAFVLWARREYDMPETWTIRTRFSWSIRHRRSHGGIYKGRFRSYEVGKGAQVAGGATYLAMARHVDLDPSTERHPRTFHEYKSFAKDPDIGSFECKNLRDYLRLLTIHECSHALQDTGKFGNQYNETERKGHKALWRDIYRLARAEFGFSTIDKVEEPGLEFWPIAASRLRAA
jgi:hypothetical protein